jgi:hypothetical protein
MGLFNRQPRPDPKLAKATEQERRAEDIARRVTRLKQEQTVVEIRTRHGRTRAT